MIKKHNRCIIFGGGGFIGSHLTKALLKKGYTVTVFSHKSTHVLDNLSEVIDKITFIEGDIGNIDLLKKTIRPGDMIFDLANSSVPASSLQSPIKEMTQISFPHIQLMKLAFEMKVGKIMFVSSGGGVYGEKVKFPISETALPQPISPHAIGKLTTEYYLHYFVKEYDIPYIVYRISNVYGPGQTPKRGFGIVPTLFSNVINNDQPVLFDHGNLIRDFVYIDDVINAFLCSFDKKNRERTYNIGSGIGTDIKSLWNTIQKITHTKLKPDYKEKRIFDVKKNVLDISLFSSRYHWVPKTKLNTGLTKTWKWIVNKT